MPRLRRSNSRSVITPREYEEFAAAHFREQGYATELTPHCNDYGVDVFARKGAEKLAIQAKMYGGTARKVNREMVMQLHGAKDYFDCTGAVIVTDGEVAQSARTVAIKLRIAIHPLIADGPPDVSMMPGRNEEGKPLPEFSFEHVWEQQIMPLSGQTIIGVDGRTNKLLRVDWSGVRRLTSSGREQFIRIEIFREAVNRIDERGCITRSEINEEYAKRASSGVVLILAQVPWLEHLSGPSRLVRRTLDQA